MTLTLCGFPVSNYTNKVKLALLEKAIPFVEEPAFPSQEPEHLALSPRGKVPFLRVDGTTLCESQVIVEYLEEAFPAVPLYPADPLARAQCRELIAIMELYVELVARRLYPAALVGAPLDPAVKDQVAAELAMGIAAFRRRLRFAPFIAGERLTYADAAAAFHLPLIGSATEAIYGEDLLAGIPGLHEYLHRMYGRPHVAALEQARQDAMPRFIAAIRRRYGLG